MIFPLSEATPRVLYWVDYYKKQQWMYAPDLNIAWRCCQTLIVVVVETRCSEKKRKKRMGQQPEQEQEEEDPIVAASRLSS
jgi:hypothetical protein